uniref:Uncharacterized protein n=1 Tax=Bactrocera dorsalis TaxID=27457 RepID=A0A034VUU1_BACDO
MELGEFGVEELESKNCSLLAETQDEFSMYALVDDSKKNGDFKDESDRKNSFVTENADTNQYLSAFSVNKEMDCKNLPKSISSTEVIEEIEDLECMGREHIMFYNSRLDSEVENDLLSEISPVNPLDCSSFSDYNEFNLCLNNILNFDGDEVIHELLSPRAIISADNLVRSGGIGCSSSTKPLRNIKDSTDDWGQRLIRRSQDQPNNIFDIIHLSEDMDPSSYQADPQVQPHTIGLESRLHNVAKGLEKDENDQERPIT